MGTITTRKRQDGTLAHTAQIRIKRGGVLVHTEAQTFERKQAAQLWLQKRQAELAQPGALERLRMPDPPLADVIGHYLRDTRRSFGKTKKQVLATIAASWLGRMRCSTITSQDLLRFAQEIGGQPSTAGNYLSHLASVFRVARPAWGYQLDPAVMDDARTVATKLGIIARSNQRDRRPTLAELDRLLDHFGATRSARVDSIPMQEMVVFAIFSTRRQEEITRMVFEDLDEHRPAVWVRDMKHPGEKEGNDVLTTLTPQALRLILNRRGADKNRTGRIFPYNAESVSTAFTRACKVLGIEDLRFHDLRHEGISRLFELGWNIPHVATVSGHRSWASLKRYTHIRQAGDKYAGWPWLAHVGAADTPSAVDSSANQKDAP